MNKLILNDWRKLAPEAGEVALPAMLPPANPSAREAAARLRGPGFATRRQLADHLRVGARGVAGLAAHRGLRANRAGRFAWEQVWDRLWGIRSVPPGFFAAMKAPLLTNADVAAQLGVSARTIRRDGDRSVPRLCLPPHLDLSERLRLHHPLRVRAWADGLPLEAWLRPGPARGALGLVPRRSAEPGAEPDRNIERREKSSVCAAIGHA